MNGERTVLAELRKRLDAAEADASRLRERVRDAEYRADLARRDAAEAWTFTRTVLQTTKPRDT